MYNSLQYSKYRIYLVLDGTLVSELCHVLIRVARRLYSWSLTTQCSELHNLHCWLLYTSYYLKIFGSHLLKAGWSTLSKKPKKCQVLRKTTEIIEIKRLVSNLLWQHNTKAGNF